jgi:hypothetical protein
VPGATARSCALCRLGISSAVFLGLAGAFAWRYTDWRRRTAVLLFELSLAPAAAATYYWDANPVALFLQAHLSVVGLMLWTIGRRGDIRPS